MQKALTRFHQLYNIRPGEGGLVGLSFLLYLALTVPYVLFYTAAYALFLEQFDSAGLSYYYLAAAPLLFLATLGGLKAVQRLSLARYLQSIVLLLMAGTLAFWLALRFAPVPAVIFSLVIWKDFLYVFLTIAFWTGANSLFNVRQGKRLFPVISTASSLSYILGGLVIPGLVALGGTENLALWAGLLLLPAWLLQRAIFRRNARLLKTPQEAQAGPAKSLRLGELRDPYLVLLFAMIFLFWIGYMLVNTIFYDQAALQFPETNQLASFIGIFSVVIGVITLAMDSFVSGRVMEKSGLRTSLLLMPLGLSVSAAALLAAGWLGGAAALVFGMSMVLKIATDGLTGLTLSAQQILYQPLPAGLRVRIQSIVEGIVGSAASAAAGLLLIWIGNRYGSNTLVMTAGLLPVLLIWLGMVWPITRHYLLWLRRALARRQVGEELLVLDPASLAILTRELASPYPEVVIYASARLEENEPRLLLGLLPGLLERPEERVRQDALERTARLDLAAGLQQARRILSADPSPLVRSSAARLLIQSGGPQDRPLVLEHLSDPSGLVRRQITRDTLCSGEWTEMRAARRRLGALAVSPSPAERLEAAELLQEAGVRSQFRLAQALIDDPARRVRAAGLASAGRLAHPSLWPAVLAALGEHTAGIAAGKALAAGLRRQDASLLALLAPALAADLAAWPGSKRRLARLAIACGSSASPAAVPFLLQMLNAPEPEIQALALPGLWSCGYRAAPEAQPAFSQRIAEQAACAAWSLAAAADLPNREPFSWLQAALARQTESCAEAMLLLLALASPEPGQAESIHKARQALQSSSLQARAFAVDMLDAVIARPVKNSLLPLLEPLPLADKLARLPAELRPERAAPDRRLREIISEGGFCHGALIRAWAVHAAAILISPELPGEPAAAANAPGLELAGVLAAAAQSTDPLVQETARSAAARTGSRPRERGARMLTTIERIIILKRASLFSEIPDEYLADLAKLMEEIQIPAGQAIIRQGEPGDCMYVIVAGRVRVHVGETTLNELEDRQVFGELALLDNELRSASVTALDDSLLLRLDQEPFYELVEDQIGFSRGIIRALIHKIRTTQPAVGAGHEPPGTV